MINSFYFEDCTIRFWPDKETPSTRSVSERIEKLASPTISELLENFWVPSKKGPGQITLILFYYDVPVLQAVVKSNGAYRLNRCDYAVQTYREGRVFTEITNAPYGQLARALVTAIDARRLQWQAEARERWARMSRHINRRELTI